MVILLHREKIFNFNNVNIIIFSYIFGVVSTKSLSDPGSPRNTPVLSSSRFIVLHLTFRIMIHFELFFVRSMKSVSKFIVFNMNGHLFQHRLLKRLIFFLLVCFFGDKANDCI